ncbi:MAG TPA: hypothetical protein VHY35_02865 [Stellaceae bacterium]|jgi:hypothetical protein|nr:hypothetical protein [Stellaceae bacterium]
MRAQSSGNTLSYRDIRFIKGMLLRGDRQHDIAAYFGVNGGRIAEVATGDCAYPNAEPMPAEDLPPPGPYLTKFALQSVIDTVNDAIEAIELAEQQEDVSDVKTALILAKEILVTKIRDLKEV